MLKSLLLSGWFRVQPFLKYAVVAILISPLLGSSVHSTYARQSQVIKHTSGTNDSPSAPEEMVAREDSLKPESSNSVPVEMANVGKPQLLPADQTAISTQGNHSQSSDDLPNSLVAVRLAPANEVPADQPSLVQKLKDAKIKSLQTENISQLSSNVPDGVGATKVVSNTSNTINTTEVEPNSRQPDESQEIQADPIGSPHPIPWKWITLTQEAIGGQQGAGVRYYRSRPVFSPDRKYAVYSRVKLEVQPEMYNSRVTSVLFVQDMQTKRLRVMASTSPVYDPLLKQQVTSSEQTDTNGTIEVLVPVSWSEKGERFLARKFAAIFNTADATDQAVIWDRQQNHTNTVAPAQSEDEHEKIAILLGWSKSQPDHVLFRAGELGEENWPLVKVASDGKTVTTPADEDQPITFGEKISGVWDEPQVASR